MRASPATSLAIVDHGVLGTVSVASWAMRLRSLLRPCLPPRRTNASTGVLCARYRLQMLGIDAAPNAALMVEFESIRHFPEDHFVEHLVGEPARPNIDALPHPDTGVSFGITVSRPQPASGVWFWRNLIHDPFHHRAQGNDACILSFSHLRSHFRSWLGLPGTGTAVVARLYFTPQSEVISQR